MQDLRQIQVLESVEDTNRPGPAPDIVYPSLDQIFVNEDYQRGLSKASMRQIRKMAQNWDWNKYKVPNLARIEGYDDRYEVVDGQHSLYAIAANGNILVFPCILSQATATKDKASGFLGINESRIALTQAQKYNARLAEGDEVATSIQVAMNAAGVRLLAFPPPNGNYEPGDTMSVGTMTQIVNAKGGTRLRKLLNIAKYGGCVPISSLILKSIDLALPRDAPADQMDRVVSFLKGNGAGKIELVAKSRTPKGERVYETLADLIVRNCDLPQRAGKRKEQPIAA